MKRLPTLWLLILALSAVSCKNVATTSKDTSPPNVVIIMADDLGYSDLGSFGGEIRTPHIDALAKNGVRFTQFRNAGRCCPSRASLLTGRGHHSVEMGWMTAVDEHRPGYRGQITDTVPTIAEIFKQNGYSTYMSGKWHVSIDGSYSDPTTSEPNGSWPTERGFDQFYGGLSGGDGYYTVSTLTRNTTPITDLPDDYYYTTAITKYGLEFINGHDTNKPLFLYLAHYAPHRPMEAPEDRIAPYRDMYAVGYDVLRQARYERMQAMGIVQTDAPLPLHEADYDGNRPAWDSLSAEQQAAWVEEMATFAAMVEIMDDGIGETVAALKARGMYDNTLILFLSDNGATRERGEISKLAASLSNTPYRQFKQYNHEGGIKSPLIVQLPERMRERSGELNRTGSHIMDLLSTTLDIADIDYPETFRGRQIDSPQGISLLPALEGKPLPKRDFFFEHQTASAIISDGWKLVRLRMDEPWELYELTVDPFEQNNVAAANPERVKDLIAKWQHWGEQNNVFPLEPKPWRERINYYKAKYPDQDGID